MDIFTPLYHEGVNTFHTSLIRLKGGGGGGGGRFRDIIQIFFPRFRFFFIFIQICLSWRVAGLYDAFFLPLFLCKIYLDLDSSLESRSR